MIFIVIAMQMTVRSMSISENLTPIVLSHC